MAERLKKWEASRLDWEQVIKEYEEGSDEKIPDSVIVSLLITGAPEPLKTHLEVNSAGFINYQQVVKAVVAYIATKRNWNEQRNDDDPMEVDMIQRQFATLKGKLKGYKGGGKYDRGKGGKYGKKGGYGDKGKKGGEGKMNYDGGKSHQKGDNGKDKNRDQ